MDYEMDMLDDDPYSQFPFPIDSMAGTWGERRSKLIDETERDYLAWRVVPAEFVSLDAGTGLVHIAPAFGEDDYELLKKQRQRFANLGAIPLFCPVGPDGKFTSIVGPKLAGRFVKEADRDIIRQLKENDLLIHQENYRHEYPFCWRAEEDPLIQYARTSWFIRTTAFRDEFVKNNLKINWLPEHIRDGRFGNFLENNVDWALSRERFWGTPLPIWQCEQCGYQEAVASYEDLLAKEGATGVEVWEEAKRRDPELVDDLRVHKRSLRARVAVPLRANVRRATDLADHDDRVRLGIGLELAQAVDEVGAGYGVATDADACRHADPLLLELVERLVRQRA
jgi:isoleucyl-tRNA synthetase